uniref:Protein TsetseEP domain-containing protein n=1 Tax=Anopheles culicifacies TaxID=139723 RepID=A0A182MBU9_9DIPT
MTRWTYWLLFAGSVLLGGCSCAGDFGLPYSVPGFDANFRSGIGSGIVAIVKANATLLKYEANLDRSGATTTLFTVANNLTSPLNKLLGHVAATFGANSTDALQTLMDELQASVLPTTSALEQASSTVRTLQGAIRPNVLDTLTANVSTVASEIGTLARNWPPFAEALRTAGSSDSTYSSANVSTLITASMVESLTSPILLINSALADIANAFGAIAKDRTTAIGYETTTNTSIQNALQDLSGIVTIANRTLTDTARQMEQQSNGTVRQVRDGYSSLLTRLGDTPESTTVKTYLQNTEAQGLEHNKRTGELLRDLASNYRQIIQSAGDAIGTRLRNATGSLIDESTVSDNSFADRCLQRYIGDFRQAPYLPTRLSVCYQVDSRTVGYFTSANNAFLEQLRNTATYGNQALSVCGQGSSNCTAEYVEQLEGFSKQNQARLNAFVTLLAEEMVALGERYDACTRAIRADIEHQMETTKQKTHRHPSAEGSRIDPVPCA